LSDNSVLLETSVTYMLLHVSTLYVPTRDSPRHKRTLPHKKLNIMYHIQIMDNNAFIINFDIMNSPRRVWKHSTLDTEWNQFHPHSCVYDIQFVNNWNNDVPSEPCIVGPSINVPTSISAAELSQTSLASSNQLLFQLYKLCWLHHQMLISQPVPISASCVGLDASPNGRCSNPCATNRLGYLILAHYIPVSGPMSSECLTHHLDHRSNMNPGQSRQLAYPFSDFRL
jgi:hypothetical protein